MKELGYVEGLGENLITLTDEEYIALHKLVSGRNDEGLMEEDIAPLLHWVYTIKSVELPPDSSMLSGGKGRAS